MAQTWIRPDGAMVEVMPARCPNGHLFTAATALVGWDNLRPVPCRVWRCRVCDAAIWDAGDNSH